MHQITIQDNHIKNINVALEQIVKNVTLPVAIRLIHNTLKQWYPSKTSEELYDMLLFKTPPSLAFQKSDIHKIFFVLLTPIHSDTQPICTRTVCQ